MLMAAAKDRGKTVGPLIQKQLSSSLGEPQTTQPITVMGLERVILSEALDSALNVAGSGVEPAEFTVGGIHRRGSSW